MDNDKILYGKLPSPINKNEKRELSKEYKNKNDVLIIKEENIKLKNELDKLKNEYNILNNKLKIFESEVCCGCCGIRWCVTMN